MGSERNADSRSKAQKVLQKSEQQGRNEFSIAYDEMNPFRYVKMSKVFFVMSCAHLAISSSPFSLDCFNLKPIYKGSPSVKCSYCASVYSPDYKGKVCLTCGLASVGIEAIGLVTQSSSASSRAK